MSIMHYLCKNNTTALQQHYISEQGHVGTAVADLVYEQQQRSIHSRPYVC